MNKPSAIKVKSVNASQHIPYIMTPEFAAVAQAIKVIAENKDVVEKAVKVKAKADLNNLKKFNQVSSDSKSLVVDLPHYLIDSLNESYAFFVEHEKVYVQYKIDDKAREYAVGPFSHFEPCVLLPLLCDVDECVNKLQKADVMSKNKTSIPPKLLKAAQAIKNNDASAAKFFVKKEVCKLANSDASIVKFTFKLSAMVAALVASEIEAANQ